MRKFLGYLLSIFNTRFSNFCTSAHNLNLHQIEKYFRYVLLTTKYIISNTPSTIVDYEGQLKHPTPGPPPTNTTRKTHGGWGNVQL